MPYTKNVPSPGADSIKAAITWVGAVDDVQAEVHRYHRLSLEAQPETGGKNYIERLNTNTLKAVTVNVEPWLGHANKEDKFQFERYCYFVADRMNNKVGWPMFSLAVD